MSRVRRAVYFSFLQKGITFGAQFAATIAIARFLSPEEIGVYSVAAAVIGIAHVVRQFGITDYIVQEQSLDREKLRSAFTVSMIVGTSLAAVFYFAADPIARYYKAPDIATLVRALSINFVLLPIGSVTTAVLVKNLEYGALALAQCSSVIVGSLASVLLAAWGQSYFSLAIGAIGSNVCLILLLAMIAPKQMVLLPSLRGTRRVLNFSMFVTGSSLVDYATSRAPELVMPRTLGFEALGLFSRGYGLINSFYDIYSSTFLGVAKPLFAQAASDSKLLARTYLAYLEKTAIVPIFFGGFVAIFSDQIIFLLFGPNWSGAAPVLLWYGVSLIVGVPILLAHVLLLATGQVKTVLNISIAKAMLAIVALLASARFELATTAAALALGPVLFMPVYIRAIARRTGVGAAEIARACMRGAVPAVTGVAVVSPLLGFHPGDFASAFYLIGGAGLLATTVMLIMCFWLKHPITEEITTVAVKLRARLL